MKGFKYFSALALFVLLAATAQAAPSVCVRYPKGKAPQHPAIPICVDKVEVRDDTALFQRVVALRDILSIPADWHFFVLSEAEWSKATPATHTAYSNLSYKTTFLRESYVKSATDTQLQQTIAHEMGHRICQCTDEDEANRIAALIQAPR